MIVLASDVDGVVAGLMEGFTMWLSQTHDVHIPVGAIDKHSKMGDSPNLRVYEQELRASSFPTPGKEGGIGGALMTFLRLPRAYLDWVKPIDGAIEAFTEIKDLGIEQVFTTANMKLVPESYASKYWWLQEFFPDVPIITTPSDYKHYVKCDYAVDDRWDVCDRFERAGTISMMIKQPWSEAPPDAIPYDWKKIVEVMRATQERRRCFGEF